MKIKENYYLYTDSKNDIAVLFDTYNSKKYRIPQEIALKIKKDRLNECEVQKINSVLSDKPIFDEGHSNSYGIVSDLRLLVTNKCNFNCTYCYANGGSYNMRLKSMSIQMAKDILDYYYDKYSKVSQISFFGGEPLVNFRVIEAVCEYARKKWGSDCPCFSMVTNGALISDEVVLIIRKYNIFVTVSIDGPGEVTDLQRISRDGRSAFALIDKGLKNLGDYNNVALEITYTSNHEQLGMSRGDVIHYIQDKYPNKKVVINDVNIDESDCKNLEVSTCNDTQMINRFFDDDTYCDDHIFYMLRNYLNGIYDRKFCGAGFDKFTIDMDGNIYPCHLFVGNSKYVMGNVRDGLIDLSTNQKCVCTKDNGECTRCSYKTLCSGCSYDILLNDNKKVCERNKAMGEIFLQKMLCLFVTDSSKYKKVIEKGICYGRKYRIS